MVRDDEVFLEEKITRNRSLRQRNIRDDILDTRKKMKFKGDLITIQNNTLINISKEDKHCVSLFNRKVRYKEPKCELQIPPNFKELMEQK